jgi:hypothetical protein
VPNPGYFHSPSSLPKLSVSLKSPGKMFWVHLYDVKFNYSS